MGRHSGNTKSLVAKLVPLVSWPIESTVVGQACHIQNLKTKAFTHLYSDELMMK